MNSKSRRFAVGAVLVTTLGAGALASCGSDLAEPTAAASADQSAEIAELKERVLELTKGNDEIQTNLETFDTLDFDVFSNQEWDRMGESHADDIKVVWPDGRVTEGLDVHVEDLKQLFVHAPDTRIKEHPIGFGVGEMTVVEGVFEGTFTEPMPDGNGGFIEPTGMAFKMPMATIGIWEGGVMIEEHLFWDNATYAAQIGL